MRVKNNSSEFKFITVVAMAILAPFIFARIISFIQSNILEESLPSVFNLDTGENNQYQIKGQVESLPKEIHPVDIYLNLYLQKSFRIFGIVFKQWSLVSTTAISSDLGFSFSHLGAGDYKLTPLSNHGLNIYFPKNYLIKVNDHNPKRVIIFSPLSFRGDYIKALFLTRVDN